VEKLAAFDIGSNAIRMALGELSKDGILTIFQKTRIPLRLGTEAFTEHHFSQLTIDQAVKVFEQFKKNIENEDVTRFRAVATSAYRNADNSEELGGAIFKNSGILIESIDGQMEAALIREAIQSQIDLTAKNYLLFDIGGGSTELTMLEKGKKRGSISIPIGTVRLLEIGKKAQVEGGAVEEAYLDFLRDQTDALNAFFKEFYPENKAIRVVGTGGNFKRLSRLRKKILGKSSVRYVLPDEVAAIREALEETNPLNRTKKFGLRPDRADVIIPAIYIIEKVMGHVLVRKIITPDIGLVQGVLHHLAASEIIKVR